MRGEDLVHLTRKTENSGQLEESIKPGVASNALDAIAPVWR